MIWTKSFRIGRSLQRLSSRVTGASETLVEKLPTFFVYKCGLASLSERSRLNAAQVEALAVKLESAAGHESVSLAEAVRSQHCQDEGPEKGQMADIVVYTTSTQQVAEVSIVSSLKIAFRS